MKRVRRATLDDLDAVVAMRMTLLREEAKSSLFAELRDDAVARAERLFAQQLADANQVTFLAFDGAMAVGILRCAETQLPLLVKRGAYALVTSAWVQPGHRRRGVMRALVAAAEAWCRDRKLTDIRLRVTVENYTGSATWDALGFRPVEVIRRRVLSGR